VQSEKIVTSVDSFELNLPYLQKQQDKNARIQSIVNALRSKSIYVNCWYVLVS
jgi:hypothetical protein